MESIKIVADATALLRALKLPEARNLPFNSGNRLSELIRVKTLPASRTGKITVGLYPTKRFLNLLAALRAGKRTRKTVKRTRHRQVSVGTRQSIILVPKG
jgi:hypothetical protein